MSFNDFDFTQYLPMYKIGSHKTRPWWCVGDTEAPTFGSGGLFGDIFGGFDSLLGSAKPPERPTRDPDSYIRSDRREIHQLRNALPTDNKYSKPTGEVRGWAFIDGTQYKTGQAGMFQTPEEAMDFLDQYFPRSVPRPMVGQVWKSSVEAVPEREIVALREKKDYPGVVWITFGGGHWAGDTQATAYRIDPNVVQNGELEDGRSLAWPPANSALVLGPTQFGRDVPWAPF